MRDVEQRQPLQHLGVRVRKRPRNQPAPAHPHALWPAAHARTAANGSFTPARTSHVPLWCIGRIPAPGSGCVCPPLTPPSGSRSRLQAHTANVKAVTACRQRVCALSLTKVGGLAARCLAVPPQVHCHHAVSLGECLRGGAEQQAAERVQYLVATVLCCTAPAESGASCTSTPAHAHTHARARWLRWLQRVNNQPIRPTHREAVEAQQQGRAHGSR